MRILYLETLRDMGTRGVEGLKTIAGDKSVEPSLRGFAISQLPFMDRRIAAEEVMDAARASDEMKIYAFEVMSSDGHPRIEELAKKLLEECGRAARAGSGSPEQRYLWLSAIRALAARSKLTDELLLPLLPHVVARGKGGIDKRLLSSVESLVDGLIEDAARRMSKRKLTKRIDTILDLIIEHGINTRIDDKTRKSALKYVQGQLAGLKGRKGDTRYKTLVKNEVAKYLLGTRRRSVSERAQFEPVVLLEDEILLALGRTRSKKAADALATFVRDNPDSRFRAHACLGVGLSGHLDLASGLVTILLDRDAFTRFCAYEALRHLTGKAFFADWMYGDRKERFEAASKYRALLAKKR